MPQVTVTHNSLGATLYYDTDLSKNCAPLRALWEALLRDPLARPIQWTSTATRTGAKEPLDLAELDALIGSGDIATAAIEVEPQALLVQSHTTAADRLRAPLVPRAWRYDTAIAVSHDQLVRTGTREVIEAIVAFADAVAIKAGVIFWTDSAAYSSGLATGTLGTGLTADQQRQVRDSHDLSNHWGRIIRGPAWGTFLGPDHAAALGDVTSLPAHRIVRLKSGGVYVELTTPDNATSIDEPSPELDRLRAALGRVQDLER